MLPREHCVENPETLPVHAEFVIVFRLKQVEHVCLIQKSCGVRPGNDRDSTSILVVQDYAAPL